MRATSVLAASVGLLAHLAAADFYMYYAMDQTAVVCDPACDISNEFFSFAATPDCTDAGNALILDPAADVSGDSGRGVRCVGCDLTATSAPTEMEIHTDNAWVSKYTPTPQRPRGKLKDQDADLWMLAWYADRGGDLVDVNAIVVGNCVVDTSDDYQCTFSSGSTTWGYVKDVGSFFLFLY